MAYIRKYCSLTPWVSWVAIDNTQSRQLFDKVIPEYVDILTSKLDWAKFNTSYEGVVLFSLAFNGPTLIGGGLTSALASNDRAEAWFQIRHQSNGGGDQEGTAKRRYYESQLFGLYDDGVNAGNISDNQAKEVYRMFANRREIIMDYENRLGAQVSLANSGYGLSGNDQVKPIDVSMNPAYTYLINTYTTDTDITIDWRDVQVAEESGSTLNGTKRTGNIFGTLEEQDDLLIGSDVNDILNGNDGNDILQGEGGVDVLDGGWGNDYLNGGVGRDYYIFHPGDGIDTIDDTDKLGTVIYELGGYEKTLRGGRSQTSAGGTYNSVDNSISYRWNGINGSRLFISIQGSAGFIIVEDFSNGNLGISLVKPPKPPVLNLFTEAQTIRMRHYGDPLALDLDGLETIGVNGANSVLFDLNNDGNKVATGWIAPDDGLLAYDRNNNGTIDDGSELFGDATPINNDTAIAADGFEALADFDSNADGVVDANDVDFVNLRVWQDGAIDGVSDGITQTGELKTLDELGIESISTAYENTQFEQNGNIISALGSYTRVDGGLSSVGSASLAGDLNFVVDTYFSEFIDSIPLTAEATVLPLAGGAGRVRNTQEAASLSPEFATALATYSAATTRDGQLALLDDLLLKWSESSDMPTMKDNALAARYLPRYFLQARLQWLKGFDGLAFDEQTFVNMYSGTVVADADTMLALFNNGQAEEYYDWINIVEILEKFNGQSLFQFSTAEDNWGIVKSNEILITVNEPTTTDPSATVDYRLVDFNIVSGAERLLRGGYQTLKDTMYVELLTQTRLKPYLDAITVSYPTADAVYDFSGLESAINTAIQTDNVNGLTDLIELINYTGETLTDIGWNGVSYLVNELQGLTLTLEVRNLLDALNVVYPLDSSGVITGDVRDNIIIGSEVVNFIQGMAGKDFIYGNIAGDDLYGGTGDDEIYGGGGDDRIFGNENNDHLYGENGIDTINGNAGLDTIFGGNDGDIISGGDDDDVIYGEDGADTIMGDAGHDKIYGGAGGDTIDGGAGSDFLSGGAGNDTLGSKTSDNMTGGFWNGSIYVGNEYDGGTGNDTLNGSVNADTYYFAPGDGRDIIDETGGGRAIYYNDKIVLNTGISPDDVSVDREESDLLLNFSNGTDQIRITDWYVNDANRVESVEFSDGITVWNVDKLHTDGLTIYGTAGTNTLTGLDNQGDFLHGNGGDDSLIGLGGNDYLYGGAGNDTYIFNPGFESANITDSSGNADTIVFSGYASTDAVIQYRAGTIEFYFEYPDQLVGDAVNYVNEIEYIQFDGEASWDQTKLYNSINEYKFDGSSPIRGNMGDNRYLIDENVINGFNIRIEDEGGYDSLDLSWYDNFNSTIESAYRQGNDLVMDVLVEKAPTLSSARGQVRIVDQFTDAGNIDKFISPWFSFDTIVTEEIAYQIGGDYLKTLDMDRWNDEYKFVQPNSNYYVTKNLHVGDDKDNTLGTFSSYRRVPIVLYGRAGDDILKGQAGNDVFYGGLGNDLMQGSRGNDTYYINPDEYDEVFDYGRDDYVVRDKIVLPSGVSPYNLNYRRDIDDLWINNTKIRSFFVDSFTIAGTTYLDPFRIENLNFDSGTFNLGDFVRGRGLYDFNVIQLDGSAVEVTGTDARDIIIGTGADDIFSGGLGADQFHGDAGNDILGSKTGNDFIGFSLISGLETGNEYTGGTGNDTLNGSLYGDTYYFNSGDGMDTIDEIGGLSGDAYADKIILGNGITATDIRLTRENTGGAAKTDLLINFNNNNSDQIRIKNWYSNDADRVESLVFADGSAAMDVAALTDGGLEIHGGAGVDYMYGLENRDDRLYGEAGADYLFGFSGNDKLYGGGGADTLVGLAGADELYGGNDNDVLYGLGGDDILDGGAGSDQLYGAGGNDILGSKVGADYYGFTTVGNKVLGNEYWGGQGIDLLNGSYLGDTYYFNIGDGTDTIDETGGLSGDVFADKIILGEGISTTDIMLTRENTWGAAKTDLLINFNNNSTDQIRIKNWYGNDADRVESLVFADGVSSMDVTSLAYDGLELHGGEGVDSIYGLENQDDRLYGENGNDTLFGYGGNDKLYGGNGVDTLLGFSGADELYGGNDNDKLFGLSGNDVLDGGAGSDTYFGGAGSDILGSKSSDDFYSFTKVGNKILGNEYWGGQGTDTLNGSLFADTYYFNIGDGADTIDETRGVNVASYADTLVMGAGINSLDLIFRQDGNDLAVSRAGSADRVTVMDWYSGASNQVETIALNDGTELLNTQVDLMIQAMATFSTDNGSIAWEQAIQENSTEFQSLISAYWQPAA